MKAMINKNVWRDFFFILVFISVVFTLYSHTFHSPFTFDDWISIEKNPSIMIENLNWDTLKDAAFGSAQKRRPVPYVSFALNYYFHQLTLPGYHLVNIIIHLINAILLYYLFGVTLNLVRPLQVFRTANTRIAFVAALIWLVHPLHVESVTYIVQRVNSLAVLFYSLTLLLYVKARLATRTGTRFVLFSGCIISAAAAFASKEITFTLPFFILLYEWFFLQDLQFAWLKKYSALLIILAGVGIFIGLQSIDYNPVAFIAGEYAKKDFTLLQRLLTESRVVVFYLSLLILPLPGRLNLDHDFPLSHALLEPAATLLSLGLLLVMFVLAVKSARNKRLLSFGLLWFLGNLVIESSFIGIEIIYEHRTYLPSTMLILAGVYTADRFLQQHRVRIIVAVIVVMLFSIWTYQRNMIWQDEMTLQQDIVAKSPHKARAQANLAYLLEKNENYEAALSHYQQALNLNPSKYDELDNIYYNYANLLLKLEQYEEAVSYYYKAIEVNPDALVIRSNLAYALAKQGKIPEAADVMAELLQKFPGNARAHNDLGVFLLQQGKIASAEYHFKEALRLGYEKSRINLMNIEKIRSRRKRSRSLFMPNQR